MDPLADVKTGLKFEEVIHSTMMHRRRCCCLSGIDTQVSGGDDYASGLSVELKASYGLSDTKSSNENKSKSNQINTETSCILIQISLKLIPSIHLTQFQLCFK